jgi:hypothetical protein
MVLIELSKERGYAVGYKVVRLASMGARRRKFAVGDPGLAGKISFLIIDKAYRLTPRIPELVKAIR